MSRFVAITALILFGLSRPASALPEDWSKAVTQLADAAGILSSRSCRDSEKAEQAAQVLSHLLHRAAQSKHLDYAAGRHYRRKWVIPTIQSTRGLSQSSRDCEIAREVVRGIMDKWAVPRDVRIANSSATRAVDTPTDGSLPTAPMIGATRSDRLADGATK